MKPSPEFVALNRATFGATPDELSRMAKMGWPAWVEEQLKPGKEDAEADKRIASQKLRIEYEHEASIDPQTLKPGERMNMMGGGKSMMMGAARAPNQDDAAAKKPPKKKYKVDEKRGLTLLDLSLENLFVAQNREEYPYAERERAAREVEVATIIRACYSQWQVREVLVDFWHNHFNIDIDSDEVISAVWPAYDREVIRKHALGNFREMLQAVGQSLPMLYYLNNRTSRASPANENYARELFELHTLGAEHYLNQLYAKWREVPGAMEGKAAGYIDQDVYEAARAFTGWTAADGDDQGDNDRFPATGGFYYYDKWHDPYQKRVLGIELEPNQPALADGMAVLDIAAFHPGTAIHLSRKLCRRFIADEPAEELVNRVAAAWMAHAKSPDQIVHVMREILLSPEMKTGFGQKTKRPLEFLASFIRGSGADFHPNEDIGYELKGCGQHLFQWGPPTGHPDTSDYWQSPDSLLNRWKFVRGLATDDYDGEVVRMNLIRRTPEDKCTWQAVADHWMDRLAPTLLGETTREELAKWFRQYEDDDKLHWHEPSDEITLNESDLAARLGEFVALIAATPEFQLR